MADISSITLPDGNSYDLKDSEARKNIIFYGTCSTAAATQTKAVTIDGITEYYDGLSVRIRFTNAQSYNGVAKLNINSLGAKNIVLRATTNSVRYEWSTGEVVDFIYNGTSDNFTILRGGHATVSYYGATKLETSGTSTSTSTALTPSSLNSVYENIITGYPAFNASLTYEVGDRVRGNTYMYECNTAIPTPESWNANHWTILPPVCEQIDTLKNSFFEVTTPSFSSLPQTFYNANITASHEVVGNAVHLSYPKAGDIDWTITCANGSLTISGTFHGSTATTATMSLWIPAKTITLTTS